MKGMAAAAVPAVFAVPLAAASGCPSRTISSACPRPTSGTLSVGIPVYIGSAAPGTAAAATGTATVHFSKRGPILDDAKRRTLYPEAARPTAPTGGGAYAFAWPPPLTSGTLKAAPLARSNLNRSCIAMSPAPAAVEGARRQRPAAPAAHDRCRAGRRACQHGRRVRSPHSDLGATDLRGPHGLLGRSPPAQSRSYSAESPSTPVRGPRRTGRNCLTSSPDSCRSAGPLNLRALAVDLQAATIATWGVRTPSRSSNPGRRPHPCRAFSAAAIARRPAKLATPTGVDQSTTPGRGAPHLADGVRWKPEELFHSCPVNRARSRPSRLNRSVGGVTAVDVEDMAGDV